MASSNTNENAIQCRTCRCGEGDTNIWTTRSSENPDKQIQKCPNCQVLKCGPLFLSSKGIGWTSWKKRWFILTRTSLVFYRSDPNSPSQKGSEANLTLGGIDLNNSGSVVVKADKKLLTVLFPDGRDGRTFTLKAETLENLFEWKTALENALVQSPSPAHAMGQNGIFCNDIPDAVEASFEQWRDKRPVRSLVVGRPILLALEDIDGTPSFLEKALRFIEQYGIKVEGILRQSADVEEVERRVREYEQGKTEFSSDEDAHVVGDCIKHILRELLSSPVPATCCTTLVEAYRADRGSRITAMRAAIAETFPEPNRRLVQRILKMMRTVASHKSENRMTFSAVAACMAPLLLRPLLAGDCELEDDFNMGGDGSIQLLQAAAAANHAQAIVIILLEEYERIFDEELLQESSLSSDLYSESEDGDIEDESTDNDMLEDDESHDGDNGLEADLEDNPECSYSGTLSECNSDDGSESYDNQPSDDQVSESSSHIDNEDFTVTETPSNTIQTTISQHTSNDVPFPLHDGSEKDGIRTSESSNSSVESNHESHDLISNVHASESPIGKSISYNSPPSATKCTEKSNESMLSIKRPTTIWGRTSAIKNLSMESIDFSSEDEVVIQRLEMTKTDLQTNISKEVEGNVILQESLEKRKEELHEHRLALEKEVERMREQLQLQRDLRSCLEAGLMNSRPGKLLFKSSMDSKTRADLEEITLAEEDIINLKQKVADLHGQLSHQIYASFCESCQDLYVSHQLKEKEQHQDVDSTNVVQQSENPSNREDILFGAALEIMPVKKQELPSQSIQVTPTTQNGTISSGFNCSSMYKLSDAATLSNDENGVLRADHEDLKTQTLDNSPSSSNRQHLMKQYIDMINQNNKISMSSYTVEPTTVDHNASEKKPTSRDEKSILMDCDSVRSQTQVSPSSPDKQPPQKLQQNIANQSSPKYLGANSVTSIEPTKWGRNKSSKRSSCRDETQKREHAPQNSTTSTRFTSASNPEDPKIDVPSVASQISTPWDENSMLRAGCENEKSQTGNSPSSPNKQRPQNLRSQMTGTRSKSLGSSRISSVEEPKFGCKTALKKSSLKDDTIKIEDAFPNSMMSLESKSSSYAEELKTVGHDAGLKKSTSKDENSVPGLVSENMKIQTQDLPYSPDKQSSPKVQLNPTNQRSTKSQGSSSITTIEEPTTYGCNSTSMKSSFMGGAVKKETQDAQTFPSRQPSQKQDQNTAKVSSVKSLGSSSLSSSEETATVSRNATSGRSSTRGKEATSSTSSALTKLTNRLNFLKERRVQLINELQNLDVNCTLGPEGPPPKISFR